MVAKLKQNDIFCMVVTFGLLHVTSQGSFSSSCSQSHFKGAKLQCATIQWQLWIMYPVFLCKVRKFCELRSQKIQQSQKKNPTSKCFIATRIFNQPYFINADSDIIKKYMNSFCITENNMVCFIVCLKGQYACHCDFCFSHCSGVMVFCSKAWISFSSSARHAFTIL